jgi:hypothetical protein
LPEVEEMAMLEGKTRIPPVDVETLPDDLRETLEEQRKLRGAPLYPYLFYARNPAYFRAAKTMWAALQEDAKIRPGKSVGVPHKRNAGLLADMRIRSDAERVRQQYLRCNRISSQTR